jgi:[histone H3]-lysine36 N-dimethyltransferase SETMAR
VVADWPSCTVTQAKIEELGWELLPHPAHSPDLAPSDYYLFRPLKYFLRGQQFNFKEDLEGAAQNFFDSKDAAWYQRGMMKLPILWEKTIESNGDYFV